MNNNQLHVLCGERDGIPFPLSIFVEPSATEDNEGAYITVDGVTDKVFAENEDTLHYIPWEEAKEKWPILEMLLTNAKELGAI